MDLLYTYITNIPKGECLKGIYKIDGVTLYAATYEECTSTYRLYETRERKLLSVLTEHERLGSFDSFLTDRHFPIVQQSGQNLNGMHIVDIITSKGKRPTLKQPIKQIQQIDRCHYNRHKKLF